LAPSFRDFAAEFTQAVQAELIDREKKKFYFTRKELDNLKEGALDLNTYHFLRLISSKERAHCFKEYLREALRRYLAARSPLSEEDEAPAVLSFCFDKIPDFSDLNSTRTVDYFYDLEAWLAAAGAQKLSYYKKAKKIKYELALDPASILDFQEQSRKLEDTALCLYRTRQGMITRQQAPAAAYTCKRTRL